ncbi:MAG TPA: serine/threonine-protein kinase [Streptosporangiaceae bacterium]|nr:serine/threonine-protein kinase [Streptosporangiaceae bacterium]
MVRGLQPGDPPLIGPYRLVGQLGCGGMGRVFLGLSAGGRPVAVKVIRAELAADQEFRVRFSREVTAARRVSGLFTALVIDADVDGPVPWLATAYVSGPSLSGAVTRYGPMPARSALALAAGLAEGLSAIHAAAVVHCDLKPSNVLLSRDGPRVIDFGISRAAEAISVTAAGLVAGSPGFMSPEQAMGEEVGPPSDVFSLGAVLAFAATGRGPFGEGSGPELAYRLVYGEPSLDRVPAGLRPLIRHCLAKEPGERPTADELLAEVAAMRPTTEWAPGAAFGAFAGYLTPSPVSVGRDQAPWRRWWRPLAVAGVTASVLAASAAVSFALSGAVRHPSAARLQPKASTSSPAEPASAPSASPPGSSSRAASSPSAFPGPAPADILPVVETRTSPGTSTHRAPSPAKSPSASASASPAISPSSSPPPTPGPSPSISTSPAPPVPQIMSVATYQQGVWIYFDRQCADPGQDGRGLGFTGSDGNAAGTSSQPVVIHLACRASPKNLTSD